MSWKRSLELEVSRIALISSSVIAFGFGLFISADEAIILIVLAETGPVLIPEVSPGLSAEGGPGLMPEGLGCSL